VFCEGPELDGEILNEVSRFGGRDKDDVEELGKILSEIIPKIIKGSIAGTGAS